MNLHVYTARRGVLWRAAACCGVLLAATPAWGEDYAAYNGTARDDTGAVIDTAVVAVYDAGTSNLSSIWSDEGITPKSNPFNTTSIGVYKFFIVPGAYRIVVSKGGVGSWDVDDIQIGTQAHGEDHEGTDIDITQVTGQLPDIQQVDTEADGSPVLTTDTLNFLATAEVGWTVVDGTGKVNISVDPIAIPESDLDLNYATHDNSNDPGSGEKLALAGTSGTPGTANRYVTNADSRLSDTRTPATHAATHASGGGDAVSIAASQISDLNANTDVTADLEEETHGSEHEDGGADEISVDGLSGALADPQYTSILKGGAAIGIRPIIDFIEGGNTTLTVTDVGGSNKVTVQVDAMISPPETSLVANFVACAAGTDGRAYIALDPADSADCTVGLGSAAPHVCICDGGATTYKADASPVEVNDLTAAVTWTDVPDSNVDGSNERDEVCGTTDLTAGCELQDDVATNSFSSDDADPADTGVLRLANAEAIAWEASPTGTDVTMAADSSEVIQITGGTLDAADLSGTVPDGSVDGSNEEDEITHDNLGTPRTATQYTGSGSSTNEVDLATAEAAGILPISKGGLNADNSGVVADAEILVYDGITNNAFESVPLSGDATLSASGAIEVTQADALETDPTDCGTDTFATAINTAGDLTCEAVDGGAGGEITDGTIDHNDLAQLVQSKTWTPRSMSTDGTECSSPSEVTINSGPKVSTIACPMGTSETDGYIYGQGFVLPDGFDKTADVTFELTVYLTTDGGAGTWYGVIDIQCQGEGEIIDSTWGTGISLSLTPVDGDVVNDVVQDSSAAVDTDTTGEDCDAGEILFWRWKSCDTDATPSTGCTSSAGFEDDASILAMKMEYTTSMND